MIRIGTIGAACWQLPSRRRPRHLPKAEIAAVAFTAAALTLPAAVTAAVDSVVQGYCPALRLA